MLLISSLALAAAFLALSNGANDNFKGVASLYGGGLASYRTALAWATLTTAAGSVASIFFASALLHKFAGKGLVPDALVTSEIFVISVAGGTAATVMLASRLGFPISTTHGLLGALGGAGAAAAGPDAIDILTLATSFALPLLLGPLLAIALGAVVFQVLRLGRRPVAEAACLCINPETAVQPAGAMALVAGPTSLSLRASAVEACDAAGQGRLARLDASRLADGLHWASAGAVSFARGLNDTPKIAALLLVAPIVSPGWSIAFIALIMALGGVIGARRVAETMSRRITRLDSHEGLSANLATSSLVLAASVFGLPVSTTHVSVGALFGIAMTTREANARTMVGIVLSWLVTLPVAAFTAALVYRLAVGFGS